MKLLVKYIDFHADNYQGGSGKSFEFNSLVEIEDDCKAIDILENVHKSLKKIILNHRPFNTKEAYAIQSVEILE